MNLEELQAVRSKERRTDSLQHLRDGFYDDVDGYVAELRAELDRAIEAADDPFESEEARRLHDEFESAQVTLESIWEARVAKITRYASLAAHDYPTDDEALTPEERDLYASLVERIADTRSRVVAGVGEGHVPDALADATGAEAAAPEAAAVTAGAETGSRSAGTGAESAAGAGAGSPATGGESRAGSSGAGAEAPPVDSDPRPGDSDATEGAGPGAGAPDRRADAGGAASVADPTDRTTVRLTDDVGAILGVDEREYDLASADVVTLPDENAEPLLARDAAEELERDAGE